MAGKFRTYVEDSFLMKIMKSIKICRFKHFGWDILHEQSSAPFLFIIYMLKFVFC